MTEDEQRELLETVRYLKDRQAILDCIQRESRGRDRQDVAQIAGCWWPEGMDEHGPVITGMPEYPERANKGHRMKFHMTSHNISNHLCDIDGCFADCESYVLGGLHWLKADRTTLAFGRYLDRLEKRGGEWRLLARRCTIEMSLDGDAAWTRAPEVQGFLKALWSREDPAYDRPYAVKPITDGVRW